ncbi:hypothetical protein CKA32_000655 [Geitlerinema sp. FC II]|nr:hypothetical protein CKA32_000655 [Geitlerinema sp. FC II]
MGFSTLGVLSLFDFASGVSIPRRDFWVFQPDNHGWQTSPLSFNP